MSPRKAHAYGTGPAPERRMTWRPIPPRHVARTALLAAVERGADEHLWACEYLRCAARSVTDLRQTMSLSQLAGDVYLAETARGLVEALEQLDAETEARLADVPDAEPVPPAVAALLERAEAEG